MVTTLKQILASTQQLDGVSYFDGEGAIFLAAAVSDYGRDYMVPGVPDPNGLRSEINIGVAIDAIYSGRLKLDAAAKRRLTELTKSHPDLPLRTIEEFGHFSYRDPREEFERAFDPLGEYTDLPQRNLSQLVRAHFKTMSKLLKRMLTVPGFLGDSGDRLNGLELRYFDRRYIAPRGTYYNETGSFIYYFFDEENHLVSWKTGLEKTFVREARYTLAGGTVKGQDSYPGQVSSTMLTRAKFFDHAAGDIL